MARSASLLLGLLLAGPAPAADVPTLVKQLGSPDFRTREAASKELEAVGEPAVPVLKAAAAAADEEVARRAADLLDRIARRAENDRLLAPTLVELTDGEAKLGDVLAALEKQTGYKITPPWDSSMKVTVKAGKMPFWDAVRMVCESSGIDVQGVTVPTPPRQIQYDYSFRNGRRNYYEPPQYAGPTRLGPVVLRKAGDRNPATTDGAVRVSAARLPDPVLAGVPATVAPVLLDLAPEPKLRWDRVEWVRVTKVTDEAGRPVTPLPYDDPADPQAYGIRVDQIIDGTSNTLLLPERGAGLVSTATQAVVRLKAGGGSPRVLKEFEGVVRAVVWAGPTELAAVAPGGPPATGSHALSLTAGPAEAVEGGYEIEVEVCYNPHKLQLPVYGRVPGTTEWFAQRGRGRLVLRQTTTVGDGPAGPATELGGLRVADADGQLFDVSAESFRRFIDVDGRATDSVTLTVQGGSGKPARVSFRGTRPVSVEVPFTLTGVPVAAGTGPVPKDR